jgi:hypothetical protein
MELVNIKSCEMCYKGKWCRGCGGGDRQMKLKEAYGITSEEFDIIYDIYFGCCSLPEAPCFNCFIDDKYWVNVPESIKNKVKKATLKAVNDEKLKNIKKIAKSDIDNIIMSRYNVLVYRRSILALRKTFDDFAMMEDDE